MARLLNEILKQRFPGAKATTLRRMLANGRVTVNGRPVVKWNLLLADADKVEINDPEKKPAPEAPGIEPLKIVFEDRDLLVVNKPVGLLTSTVPGEKRPTALALLDRYLLFTEPKARIGLVHRLDRDAAGLLVFSKNEMTFESLKTQFFRHTCERQYMAVVHGTLTPPDGRIESMLVELPDGTVRQSRRDGHGQKAVTDYATIAREGRFSLVRVTLQTGRKHQIRRHLLDRGCPIVGDRVYGPPTSVDRLMLAAVRLGFVHPRSQQDVRFEMEMPFPFPPVMAGANVPA
jgi:23S rRNA pseudouridine1911/1915/1917 synthase